MQYKYAIIKSYDSKHYYICRGNEIQIDRDGYLTSDGKKINKWFQFGILNQKDYQFKTYRQAIQVLKQVEGKGVMRSIIRNDKDR